MFDSKTLKIRIGDNKLLTFILDHLRSKKLCKGAVQNLPFLIKYVPDQFKTQQM